MKHRAKKSPIWKMPLDDFKILVFKSQTFTEILSYFGMKNVGGNSLTLKERLKTEGIDFSHIISNISKRKYLQKLIIPLKDILVQDSSFSRNHLKKRLLKEKLLVNECKICGLGSIWKSKPLVMILDHINGIRNDNRLENLRMVCPNCASQLLTFAGRQSKKKYFCKKCSAPIGKGGKFGLCSLCAAQMRRKVIRPSKEDLQKDMIMMSWKNIGKKYGGISDSSIRKWAKFYGLTKQNVPIV